MTLYELQVVGDPGRVLMAVASDPQAARRLCYAVAKLPSTTRLRVRRTIRIPRLRTTGLFVGAYLLDRK